MNGQTKFKLRCEQLERRDLLSGSSLVFGGAISSRAALFSSLQLPAVPAAISSPVGPFNSAPVSSAVNVALNASVNTSVGTRPAPTAGVVVSANGGLSVVNSTTPITNSTTPVVMSGGTVSSGAMSSGATSGATTRSTSNSILPGSYFTAPLSDVNGTTGLASYQTTTSRLVNSATFRVTLNNATPNSTLAISVDGSAVGVLTTDATGYGTFVLSKSEKPGQTARSLLHDPPPVHAGSTITVGTLSGVFAGTNKRF